MFTPENPNFTIQVLCNGVYITRTCLHDLLKYREFNLFGHETKYDYDSFINISSVANATIYSQRHAISAHVVKTHRFLLKNGSYNVVRL